LLLEGDKVSEPEKGSLIFDWAEAGPRRAHWPEHVMLDDETLRDGLQSPSVIDPSLETKVEILHLMEKLGIETADVCREIADNRLRIKPNCAARTLLVDIQPIAEVTQLTGVPIEACTFIGSSPIRQYAEEWDVDHILRHSRPAIEFAVREGLPVMFVTEDTVRSSPEHLRVILTAACEAGAKRLCLCDTVGAAVPEGVMNLVSWVKNLVDELGVDVGIDWHGHRDRGLDLANTLAAIQAGATRVHGTALGIGERVGNTPMEQILINLKLLGMRDDDLSYLPQYVGVVGKATGVPIAVNAPIIGPDAFRTATGVHAAAVIKAEKKGDAWLADRVYSGVPASWVGRRQKIEVGPMSGNSNAACYLEARGLPSAPDVIEAVMNVAKKSDRLLTEQEILQIVQEVAGTQSEVNPGATDQA
jgi:2-isopropylmalate synthase